ncbi:hypothetical protein KM043_000401 [Ampulex compressa]|nr:hypothetical protein KM043_000401 [Ampulex compressa]
MESQDGWSDSKGQVGGTGVERTASVEGGMGGRGWHACSPPRASSGPLAGLWQASGRPLADLGQSSLGGERQVGELDVRPAVKPLAYVKENIRVDRERSGNVVVVIVVVVVGAVDAVVAVVVVGAVDVVVAVVAVVVGVVVAVVVAVVVIAVAVAVAVVVVVVIVVVAAAFVFVFVFVFVVVLLIVAALAVFIVVGAPLEKVRPVDNRLMRACKSRTFLVLSKEDERKDSWAIAREGRRTKRVVKPDKGTDRGATARSMADRGGVCR